jgi:hypothetical protein
MSIVKLLLGKSPAEMSDDELKSHVKMVRKLRGEAFITGRQQKQAKNIASGGKEAKELSDMANTMGLTPEQLFEALLEVFNGEV